MNVPASDRTAADVVELALPLDHRHASTVRVVAAALGADAGFHVDEIDDLRLAVDEAVAAVVAATPTDTSPPDGDATAAGRLVLQFEAERGAVTIRVTRTPPVPLARDDVDSLALRIIEAVADRFEVADGSLLLTKRAATSDDG